MKFVDRTDETSKLKKALTRKKATFVAIYGRRRLGKATFIKRVLSANDVYFLADRLDSQLQRDLLAKAIAQVFPDFINYIYLDWESMFRAINNRTNKQFTLCLDEFPYLVEQAPELVSVLQKLVDEKQLKYNLIVCGSSQNIMNRLFSDPTAPLYGRADEIIKLAPLRVPYLREALNLSAVNAVEEYAVWGGIPRYWKLRENNSSLYEALWHHIFSVNGTLYEEPIRLFQDDVKDIAKTSSILSYIALGANRLIEIATMRNEPTNKLLSPLRRLIDLGFLEKEALFGFDEKDSKIYKIADPFLMFYHRFVVSNRSFIELGQRLPVELDLNIHFSPYVSMLWKKLCRDAVSNNLVRGVAYGKAKRWWWTDYNEKGKPEQIELDLVAESLDKKYLLVGECKWTTQENGKRLTDALLRKTKTFRAAKNYTVIPILFLKNEPTENIGNAILPDEVLDLLL